jgi:hypothetical protein
MSLQVPAQEALLACWNTLPAASTERAHSLLTGAFLEAAMPRIDRRSEHATLRWAEGGGMGWRNGVEDRGWRVEAPPRAVEKPLAQDCF